MPRSRTGPLISCLPVSSRASSARSSAKSRSTQATYTDRSRAWPPAGATPDHSIPPLADGLGVRRGHDRLRAAGAGPGHELPFADRVIVTLARFALPHAALALFYGVHRSTT